jgi:hypothetical protein
MSSVSFLWECNLKLILKVGNEPMIFEKRVLRIMKEGEIHSRQKKMT